MRHVLRAVRTIAMLAVAPALLPPVAALAWDPPDDAVLADLPFAPDHPSGVWVDLAPPDAARPMVLQLDTGASDSVLTPALARALGVHVRKLKSTPYRRATRLGRDLQFWVDASSSDTASGAGAEYGLLGGTFLASYVVEVDYGARRVRFLHARKGRVPKEVDAPDEHILPLKIIGNRPHVELDVAGETHLALLDTGADLPVVVEQSVADTLGVEHHEAPGFVVHGSVTRIDTTIGFTNVGFAGDVYPDTPVLVAESTFNQGANSGIVVGAPILARYVVRIDYPKRRLWLRRIADPGAPELAIEAEMRKSVSSAPTEEEETLRYPAPDAGVPEDPGGPAGL